MSKVYSVYELFDAAGKVLYVGQSNDPRGRANDHADRVNWITRIGDVSHHRQPLYMALAKSYDRLVTGTDIMRIIESGFETRKIAEAAEHAWVVWHNSNGNRVYNKAGNRQMTLDGPGVRVPSLLYQPVDVTQSVTELGINLTVEHPLVELAVMRVGLGDAAPTDYMVSRRIRPAAVVIDQSTCIFPLTKTELLKRLAASAVAFAK